MNHLVKVLFGDIVFVIVVIGIGYLLLKNDENISGNAPTGISLNTKPISSSQWEVYKNEKFGFEVSYPEKYEMIEDNKDTDFSVRKIGDVEEAQESDGVCIHCTLSLQILPQFIGGAEEGDFTTPEDWIEYQEKIGQRYVETSIAGKTAYSYIKKEGRKGYLVYVKSGVKYDRYDIQIKENDTKATDILSSFKFAQ